MAWIGEKSRRHLTNADPVHRRIYATLGGDELKTRMMSRYFDTDNAKVISKDREPFQYKGLSFQAKLYLL